MASNEERIIISIREAVAKALPGPADLEPHLKEPRIINSDGNTGAYSSRKAEGIQFESGMEKQVLSAIDGMTDVLRPKTQSIQIEYQGGNGPHIYYPDIVCKFRNGQVAVIEVKPAKTVCELYNYRKFSAAQKYCQDNNWHFIILSPREGTIKDMANEHVPPIVEKDFLKRISPDGKIRSGVGMTAMKEFKDKYKLDERVLVAIALRNNLAIRRKPIYEWVCLPPDASWKKFF